jgi:hypothetical protein
MAGQYPASVGDCCAEFVRGQFNSSTGCLELEGHDMSGTGVGVIGLDAYRLTLSADGGRLSGTTRTYHGTWHAQINLLRVDAVESGDWISEEEKNASSSLNRNDLYYFLKAAGLQQFYRVLSTGGMPRGHRRGGDGPALPPVSTPQDLRDTGYMDLMFPRGASWIERRRYEWLTDHLSHLREDL